MKDEDEDESGGGRSGMSGSGGRPGEIELDECEEGDDPANADICPWLGSDDRCYPTKEAACACLCRESGGETCSSGFPGGEQSRVPVSCF